VYRKGVTHMSPIRMSKPESAIRVVLELNERFNRHDLTGISRLLHDSCAVEASYPPPDGGVHHGPAAVTGHFRALFDLLPEVQNEIEEIFGFGSRCVTRSKLSWIADKQQRRSIRSADMYEVKNDLVCGIMSYVKGGYPVG